MGSASVVHHVRLSPALSLSHRTSLGRCSNVPRTDELSSVCISIIYLDPVPDRRITAARCRRSQPPPLVFGIIPSAPLRAPGFTGSQPGRKPLRKKALVVVMSFPNNRRGCFVCGKPGHIAAACTSTERLCFNCSEPGHESNTCPNPKVADNKQCYSCGGMGHLVAECPSIRVGSVFLFSSAFRFSPPTRPCPLTLTCSHFYALTAPLVPPAPSATTASSLATLRARARTRPSPPLTARPSRPSRLPPLLLPSYRSRASPSALALAATRPAADSWAPAEASWEPRLLAVSSRFSAKS